MRSPLWEWISCPPRCILVYTYKCTLVYLRHSATGRAWFMARVDDEARARKLRAEGLSQREIARQTGIPRTTVQDILKRSAQLPASAPSESTPDVHVGVPTMHAKGTPKIHQNTRPARSGD